MSTIKTQGVQEPVVGLSSRLELQRADRIVNVFQSVVDAVREVVGRVDAPTIASVRMGQVLDSVGD